MDKKKFNLQTFLEQNRDKIPKSVKVDIASSTDQQIEGGIVIHASTFDLGLYLPFHPLIREILSKLGVAPIQLSPNCWRIMFGIIALNQILKINLGWNEFCYCYAVKPNSAGTYYFSHRETTFSRRENTSGLVTDLPKSEKGRKDNLISLTGDWERRPGDTDTHLVPRIIAAPTKKSTGLKPRDSDVNHLDLKKAWDLPHEERKWRKLGAYLEQHGESKIADESQASLLTASCPQHNSLGNYAQNVEADTSEMTADILYSPSSSKKRKLIHPQSATSIVDNMVLTNPCSDYESIPSVAAVKSKDAIDNTNLQGSKDQETADLSKKDIKIDQLLKRKVHGEVRSLWGQTVGKFQKESDSFVVSLLNRIKELEAIIERKDKDPEELTSVKKKEPVRAGIPGATNTESLTKPHEENEKYLMLMEEVANTKGYVSKIWQAFQANMFATQQPQPQLQLPWSELGANKADMIAETIKSQQPRSHMFMDLLSSANHEPLTSQNKNDHTEGAAAATLTDMNLGLCTPPNDQNEFPGNHHHQQQPIEPSSNGNNLLSPTMLPFCVLNNFDTPAYFLS